MTTFKDGLSVTFNERTTGPERHVADAELHFGGEAAGPLAGIKLVGFSLWRSAEGTIYVSVPSRAFGAGGERRYFDLVRGEEGTAALVRLKEFILEAYRTSRG
jgi:hypothetical protein